MSTRVSDYADHGIPHLDTSAQEVILSLESLDNLLSWNGCSCKYQLISAHQYYSDIGSHIWPRVH